MGEEANNSFTESQKNLIYKEMLVPLKVKISQILLYDTKAALQFLQEYNEILENEDSLGNNIIQKITELEFKIQNYMSNDGKEKLFEERSSAILQNIDELKIISSQLTLEKLQSEFARLKADYEENIERYSFKDREKIEKEIYALQASLIMKQVAEGKFSVEMQQTITDQDKNGLNMFVLEWIDSLSQKEGLKNIANKVKNIVLTEDDAVLSPELWAWMNAAEKGIRHNQQLQMSRPANNSTAMIIQYQKRNNTLLGLSNSIKNGISRLFSKEPQLPLEIGDLKKINIEWLSRYVPESMLAQLEKDRLSKENREADDIYLPAPKTPIYEMLKKRVNIHKARCVEIKDFCIYIPNQGRKTITTDNTKFGRPITMKAGEHSIEKSTYNRHRFNDPNYAKGFALLNDALTYAQLLDQILGTDLQQQLFEEIQNLYITETSKKDSIYRGLMTSLRRMFQEYKETSIDFEAIEEENRRKFYEMHGFKESLKQHNIEATTVIQSEKAEQTTEQSKDNDEIEQ